MDLRDHYDWAVLGDNPGAIFSALLAAREGASALVVPLAPSRSPRLTNPTDFLDYDSGYFADGNFVSRLLIGLDPALEKLIDRSAHARPRILTPKGRIRLGEANGDVPGDLHTEFPVANVQHMAKLAQATYLHLQRISGTHGTSTKGSVPPSSAPLADAIRNAPKTSGSKRDLQSVSLREFQCGLQALAGGTLGGALGFARVLGGGRLVGGVSGFRAQLLSAAERAGVHVIREAECRRIFVERGRLTGVQVSERGRIVNVSGAVLGCPVAGLRPVIYFSGTGQSGRRLRLPLSPSAWRYTVAVYVNREAIPDGYGRTWIWSEAGAPPIEIQVADPKEFGLGETAHWCVLLTTLMSWKTETLQIENLRKTGLQMIRKFRELVPFVDFHMLGSLPGLKDAASVDSIYGFKELSEIPHNLLVYGGEGGDEFGTETGINGLWNGSLEAYPFLGQLGSFVASTEAASRSLGSGIISRLNS